MKKATVQTRSLAQRAIRAAVVSSVSLAMFLFAACEMNTPSGKSGSNTLTGPQDKNGRLMTVASVSTLAVPMGSAANFAVLGATTVTNTGASMITGDLGVSPGTAITGFSSPPNTFSGPGTVTAGTGTVSGTIYAGGPVAAQAHNDAVIAFNYLNAQVAPPANTYAGVTTLDGLTYTPGVYSFAPAAILDGDSTLTLDFQGNPNAMFIFKTGTTLTANAGSKIVAINTGGAATPNVFWAVGSSATINGAQFIGTVIANITITMTSGVNMAGSAIALTGAVTLDTDTISTSASSGSGGGGGTPPPPSPPCRDFVTGGGWIDVNSNAPGHHKGYEDKATFGVSGGIKNGDFWGHLSFNDHDGTKVMSTEVTGYFVINDMTREIDGVAKVNGKGSFTYKVVVVDDDKDGRSMYGHNKDSFSLNVSNGYSVSGTLSGGSINIHSACGVYKGPYYNHDKENCYDNDERGGDKNCDNDRD